MSLVVVRPGPLSLVEDLGRPGYAAVGVSASGAFDRAAHRTAAGLVGNDPRLAGVEVTLGGLAVRTTAEVMVALAGAECPASTPDGSAPWDAAFVLPAGAELRLGLPVAGLRSYLAVAGGLVVPATLGSASADLLSGLGPARLAAGDVLAVGRADYSRWEPAPVPTDHRSITLDLLPGPRTDWLFDPRLVAGEWTVSPDSNRIGVRLIGPALLRVPQREGSELPSEPLVRGAVQLPPSGQPVLFGPDHPTTGGYPVVAVLTEESSDRLAQCRPGAAVTLRWVPEA
ncbi:MAG: biotin-dependent carboxyltransferase family protein [Propionicimonas sp.]|uniref:5-oxoprolinase subunit C family protein n=1 Tax=Propionicimonas sp. TaxID=1955623 RepID=UPI003D11E678